jgi:hypothetical protein
MKATRRGGEGHREALSLSVVLGLWSQRGRATTIEPHLNAWMAPVDSPRARSGAPLVDGKRQRRARGRAGEEEEEEVEVVECVCVRVLERKKKKKVGRVVFSMSVRACVCDSESLGGARSFGSSSASASSAAPGRARDRHGGQKLAARTNQRAKDT